MTVQRFDPIPGSVYLSEPQSSTQSRRCALLEFALMLTLNTALLILLLLLLSVIIVVVVVVSSNSS
jgi:hypothetical protein